MAAAEHHKLTVGQHSMGIAGSGACEDLIGGEVNTDLRKGGAGDGGKDAGACMILGIRGHKDNIGIFGEAGPDAVDKLVAVT